MTSLRAIWLVAALALATGCADPPDAQGDAGARADAGTPVDTGTRDGASPDAPPGDAHPAEDAGVPEDGGPSGLSLIIGTGITEHIPFEDGAELPLVMGAQGGYHVDITFRACGVDPMDARLEVWGHDAETGEQLTEELVRILTVRRVLFDDDGRCWSRLGDFMIFDTFDPSTVIGRRVRIRARLQGVVGVPVEDAREIVVR